jgi:hypothetical protein
MARKKAIDLEQYSALDAYAIGLNEFYKSLRKAGFSVDMALAIIIEPSAYPDWILPSLPNKIDPMPFEDDDED